MILRNLSFDNPLASILLLCVAPLILSFIFLFRYRKSKLQALANPLVLESLIEKRSTGIFILKSFLALVVLIGAVLALMQPKGNVYYNTKKSQEKNLAVKKTQMRKAPHEVLFLLDVSASMQIKDTAAGKSREESAKEIIDQVISQLEGETVSLLVFTEDVIEIVPATRDYLFTRLLLRQVEINQDETQGTNIQKALEYIEKPISSLPLSIKKTVIILSDGGDTQLEGLDPLSRKNKIESILKPIEDNIKNNKELIVVGVGSNKGADVPGVVFEGHLVHSILEKSLLEQLSFKGEGHLILLDETTPFQASQLINKIIHQSEMFVEMSTLSNEEVIKKALPLYEFYFQWPLAFALVALVCFLVIPDTKKKKSFKINTFSILLFSNLFFNTQLFSGIETANLYFDAGNYKKAYNEYKNLLDENNPSWEQGIILYNMGTAKLLEENFEESLKEFQKVEFLNPNLTLLQYRVSANKALAHLMYFKKLQEALKSKQNITYSDYNEAFNAYNQTMNDIEKAFLKGCFLEKKIGATSCSHPYLIEKIKGATKQAYSDFLNNFFNYRLKNKAAEENIIALIIGMKSLKEKMFLKDKHTFKKYSKAYSDDYTFLAESFIPLWKILADTKNDNISLEALKKFKELLALSKKSYLLNIDFIKKDQWEEGDKELDSCLNTLNEAVSVLYSKNLIESYLNRLQITYSEALLKDPLQEAALNELSFTQNELRKLIAKISLEETFKDNFLQGDNYLKLALTAFQQVDPIKSRIYLLGGSFFIETFAKDLSHNLSTDSSTLLRESIEKESFAILINNLSEQIEDKKERIEISKLLTAIQSSAIQSASLFLPNVISLQKKLFGSFALNSCQCHPYDEVIPLFNEGLIKAKEAFYLLQKDKETNFFIEVIDKQKESINYWKEALEKLNQPVQELVKEKSPETNKAFNKVFSLLQEMEEDDASLNRPRSVNESSHTGEDRPW